MDHPLIICQRHSIRAETYDYNDPLNQIQGQGGAVAAAQKYVKHLGLGDDPRPTLIICSPFRRCMDTGAFIAKHLTKHGVKVNGLKVASSLGEDVYSLTRLAALSGMHGKRLWDLMPSARIPAGVRYLGRVTGNKDYPLTRPEGRSGINPRMMAALLDLVSSNPDVNIILVGHLHLVSSVMRLWGTGDTKLDYACFAAWRGQTERWYWSGVRKQNAKALVGRQ